VGHGEFSCKRGYEQLPVQGRRRAEDIEDGERRMGSCAWGSPGPVSVWSSVSFDRRGMGCGTNYHLSPTRFSIDSQNEDAKGVTTTDGVFPKNFRELVTETHDSDCEGRCTLFVNA
jgi:hypothetical protein